MKYIVFVGASTLTNYTVRLTAKGDNEYSAQVRDRCINPLLFCEREEAERVAKAFGGVVAETGDCR